MLNGSSSYFQNLLWCKFTVRYLFPFSMVHSTFFVPILNIVKISSQKQVVRPYATRIIALIQYVQSLRNRPNIKIVALPMNSRLSSFIIDTQTIPLFISRSGPIPARFRFINPRPEFINKNFIHKIYYYLLFQKRQGI